MFGKKPEVKVLTIEELAALIKDDTSGKIVIVEGTMTPDNIVSVMALFPNTGLRIDPLPGNKLAFHKPRNASTKANTPAPTHRRTHQEEMDLLISEESSLNPAQTKGTKNTRAQGTKKRWPF